MTYLNGHTIGFRSQTQKLELHYMSPSWRISVRSVKENYARENVRKSSFE